MKNHAAGQLGLEPRGLRRHNLAAVCNRKELIQSRGKKAECHRCLASVHRSFQSLWSPNSSNKPDPCIPPRIPNVQKRRHQVILEDRHVQRGHSILGVEQPWSWFKPKPASFQVHVDYTASSRLGLNPFGDGEGNTHLFKKLRRSVPREVLDQAVVGHDMQLVVWKYAGEKSVGAVRPSQRLGHPGRCSGAVVSIRDVQGGKG